MGRQSKCRTYNYCMKNMAMLFSKYVFEQIGNIVLLTPNSRSFQWNKCLTPFVLSRYDTLLILYQTLATEATYPWILIICVTHLQVCTVTKLCWVFISERRWWRVSARKSSSTSETPCRIEGIKITYRTLEARSRTSTSKEKARKMKIA